MLGRLLFLAVSVAAGIICQKVYDEAKTSTKAWWDDLFQQR